MTGPSGVSTCTAPTSEIKFASSPSHIQRVRQLLASCGGGTRSAAPWSKCGWVRLARMASIRWRRNPRLVRASVTRSLIAGVLCLVLEGANPPGVEPGDGGPVGGGVPHGHPEPALVALQNQRADAGRGG